MSVATAEAHMVVYVERKCLGAFRTGGQNLIEQTLEFDHARAGYDHGIAPPLGFFRDPQKAPAIIFPKLNKEVLSFDLQLARFKNSVH